MGAEYRKLAILVMGLQFSPGLQLRGSALAAGLLLASASAQARTGDTLQPYLFYNLTQDNNILLSSSNEKSELYQQFGAGLLLDWKQSRQEVTGRIGTNKTVFSKLSILDFSGYDLLGQWNWQLGNHLSGQLGYGNTRRLGSFLDFNDSPAQNTVDRANKFFNASYLFHPRWRINGLLENNALNYSATSQKTSDSTVDHAEIGADYLTPKGSRLGVYAGRWNGTYPNKQATVDNSYKQDEIGLRSTWALDGNLQLSGQIGQTKRTHKEKPQRDFSGLTGKLDSNWQATGKLQVLGSIYRDIGAVDDIYASYSVNDGIRFTPNWQMTSKLRLGAETYYENRNFKGDPFSIGLVRKDKAASVKLSLNYQPHDWASLSLAYQAQNRKSNLASDFSNQSLSLSVQLQF